MIQNFSDTNTGIPGLLAPVGAGLLTAGATSEAWLGTSAETTYTIGGVLEKVIGVSVTHYKHYIASPTGPVATYTRRNNATEDTFYFTKDHLGSVDTVTNASASVQVRLSYDAFGLRRKEAGWNGTVPLADFTAIASTSRRGYTEHEHLDNLALIHMNGRVQDPTLGRFLSADPYVTEPFNGQSFNRYSYVLNNPLSWTDPSGFAADGNDVRIEDLADQYLADVIEEITVEATSTAWTQAEIRAFIQNLNAAGGGVPPNADGGGVVEIGEIEVVKTKTTPQEDKARQKCTKVEAVIDNLKQLIEAFIQEAGSVNLTFNGGRVRGGSLQFSLSRDGISGYAGYGFGVGSGVSLTASGNLTKAFREGPGIGIQVPGSGAFNGTLGPGFEVSGYLGTDQAQASTGLGLGLGTGGSATIGVSFPIIDFDSGSLPTPECQ